MGQDSSRGPLLEKPAVVSNIVDEMTLRQNMGNKVLGLFGKGGGKSIGGVTPYKEINDIG